jgi:3-phenylpropionate/trans-cinnamate dioxygenase ferredoxin subunit
VSASAVCKLVDVPVSGVIGVVVDGTPVAVVRDSHGHLHAIRDICSHADVALSEGEVDGCTLECWLHGSRFDLRTGKPSGPPATTSVPVYSVSVEGEGDDAVVLVDVTVNAAAR